MRTPLIIGIGIAAAAAVLALQQALTRGSTEGEAYTRALSPAPSRAGPRIDQPTRAAGRAGGSSEHDAVEHDQVGRRLDFEIARPPSGDAAESRSSRSPSGGRRQEGDALLLASETFRNTTLLTAIRDAGFVCFEMLGVQSAAEDVKAWKVICEAMAYFVADDGSGRLRVEHLPAADPPRPASVPRFESPGSDIRMIPFEEPPRR